MQELHYYTNKKTQAIYFVKEVGLIDATNTTEGRMMVKYMDTNGKNYVREEQEFLTKFELK